MHYVQYVEDKFVGNYYNILFVMFDRPNAFANDQQDKVTTANSVFIKLWLDVKHSEINRYFAFVVS